MLEVCFSDSVKGTLLVAQHCGSDCIAGAVSILTNRRGICAFLEKKRAVRAYKKRYAELQKAAIPLGGRREDVLSISLGLSEGDIASPLALADCPRKSHIRTQLCFDRYGEGDEAVEDSLHELWTGCMNDLQKLQSNPSAIRVWLDHTPDAQCGILFLADLLRDSGTEIRVVELPEKITRNDDCVIEYRGWGEVAPELYGAFLNHEHILTTQEVNTFADRWNILKSENAPLRVVDNGTVQSAALNYYDDLIRKEFPKNTCKVAEIIGNTLGKQNILTSDIFIAKRIQYFIEQGELVPVGGLDERFYHTTVTCST